MRSTTVSSRISLAASFAALGLFSACNEKFSFTKIPDVARLQYASPAQSLTSKALGRTWDTISSFDLGKQPFGALSKSTVYLKNVGDLTATVEKIWIESTVNSQFFSVQSDCGNLAANDSPCPVAILYNPDTVGSTPAVLHARYNDGRGGQAEVAMPIEAVANNLALLTFENPTIDVKNDTVGYTISATLNVIYNGAALGAAGFSILPAQGVMIAEPTDSSFSIDRAGTTCKSVVSQNCSIKVNFSPTSVGSKNATFNVTYFNGSQVLTMQGTVLGTGTAAVVLAQLGGSALNFGNVVVNPRAPVEKVVNVIFNGSVPADNVTIALANATPGLQISTDPFKTTCLAGKLNSGASINGNCALTLVFNPSARAAYSNSIVINYRSHDQDRPQSVIAVNGSGVNPALVVVTPMSLGFGKVPAYKTTTQTFTIQNTGEYPVSSLSVATLSDSVNFKSSFDASCGALAPGGRCNFTVSFKPMSATDPAIMATKLGFSYDDGRATQSITELQASGSGTSALVMDYSSPGAGGSPLKAVIDFGNVMIGNPAPPSPRVATLAAFGTTPMSTASQLAITPSGLSSPFTFTGGAFPGTGQSCKTPFDPNKASSCTFSVGLVAFGSSSADAPLTQDFGLNYTGDGNNGSGTLSFQAKMTPRIPPVVNFAIAPAAFSTVSVNASTSLSFRLQNASLYFGTMLKSLALTGDSAFSIATNGCTSSLPASGYCNVVVNFKPASAGTFSGALTYTYNDQISDHTVSTSFTGTGSPNVTLVPNATTVDFGNIYIGDAVSAKRILLSYFGSNTFTSTASIPSPFSLDSSTCGAAKDCQLDIGIDPATPGILNTSFDFNYTPGLPTPAKITITLKANIQYRSPTLAVTGSSFGKVLVGSSATQTVTIQNTGTGSASGLSFPSLSGTFTYSPDGAPGSAGSCANGQALSSGQSCTIKLRFSPAQVGSAKSSLDIGFVIASQTLSSMVKTPLTGTGTQMIQLFAGAYQTCIINEVGSAFCWGRNSTGQLGQGNANVVSSPVQSSALINFGTDVKVLKLAVGDSHTCALLNTPIGSGKVSCWGSNVSGRLGLGISTAQVLAPLDGAGALQTVDLGTDESSQAEVAVDIAAGFEHTCVVLKSGRLKCWGGNTSGQLGIGSVSAVGSFHSQMGNALAAVNIGAASAVSVSAAAGHTCAVFSDGASRCWGDNFYGQLGQGVSTERLGVTPADMTSLKNIALGTDGVAEILASPGAFTCAHLSSGGVKCFGHTAFNENSANPFWGVLGTCWARPVYNSSAVQCAAATGTNPTNALGYYSTDMGENLPEVALGLNKVTKLAIGANFACALLNDKSVRCWGANEHGQLGTGLNANVGAAPSEMGANLKAAFKASGSIEPIAVATGYSHACVVLSNNTVKCWGAYTENATGLVTLGMANDTGGTSGTTADLLPVVYDGQK